MTRDAETPQRWGHRPGSPTATPSGLSGVRWRELSGLWTSLLEREPFPQVDRWLSEEFRRNARYGSRDRKWYAEMMFSAVRYGFLALFLERLRQAQVSEGGPNLSTGWKALSRFASEFPDLDAMQRAWRAMPAARVFDWVVLRYLEDDRPDEPGLGEARLVIVPDEATRAASEALMASFLAECTAAAGRISGRGPLASPHDADDALRSDVTLLLLRAGIPLWYLDALLERWCRSAWGGVTLVAFLDAQNTRPPLWLRLNYAERADEVRAELSKESFVTEVFEEEVVRATGAKGIFSTLSYRNGLFEIQDLASQRIGRRVENEPGQFVWDCCAGGGGKTMQLAARARNKGVVYASDVREYKLEEVKKRARRAGFFNIRCLPWAGEALPAFPKEIEKRNGFDWVLVDAPCSSSGTWRRNPDAKFRTQGRNWSNLGTLQLQLLSRAATAVRGGGRLVYSTCSWIVEENEALVARFLVAHPHFRLARQDLLGAPSEDADTMFAAVFERMS